MPGNANRTRTWDSLIGLTQKLSTCSGFAHIYQELCTRQNIHCVKVGGKYFRNHEGDHAWNIVTIGDKSFLVDIIWDAQNFEKGIDEITGFGPQYSKKNYMPTSYEKIHDHLFVISQKWIQSAYKKISVNIPKEQMAEERIEHFLKLREIDRQRMMYLGQRQLSIVSSDKAIDKAI